MSPRVEETWRLDDDDVLIGLPVDVLIGEQDRIYILDGKLLDVKVFSANGDFIRSLGREGDGPGEFRNAGAMSFLPDGSIGVAQAFPARIVSLGLDGKAGKQIRPSGIVHGKSSGPALARLFCGGKKLVIAGMEVAFDQASMTMHRQYFVRQYDMEGKPRVTYHLHETSINGNPGSTFHEKDFDSVWSRMTVGRDGRVFIVPDRQQYRIDVLGPDGRLQRSISREYQSWTRNNMAKAVARNMIAPQLRMFHGASMKQIEVAELEPDIAELWCAADGALWVMTSRAMWERSEGVYSSWDVYSPEGVFQKQVVIRVPGSPVLDRMVLTDSGFVLKITNFLDRVLVTAGMRGVVNVGRDGEELEVICYRIK